MLMKNEIPTVPPEDPWSVDKLDRKEVADFLTPVLSSISQPYVIALESPYGTGKTLFIECWMSQLRLMENPHAVVKFNAWASDFSDDPLAAFMACLRRAFPASKKDDLLRDMVASSKKIMRATARKAPALIVKSIVRHVVGDEGIKEVLGEVSLDSGDLADFSEAIADAALESQKVAESGVEGFRFGLEELVKRLREESNNEEKKLVIFVDELDRCRPNYTIELLECIKHLFAVPGVVFFLAVDPKTLGEAVQVSFGALDCDAYLGKFIDWRYKLPTPDAAKYASYLAQRFDLQSLFRPDYLFDQNEMRFALNAFWVFSRALGLSLRDQEQSFSEFNFAMRTVPKNVAGLEVVTAFAAVLRKGYRRELDKYLDGHVDAFTFGRQVADLIKFGLIYGVREIDRGAIVSWFATSDEASALIEKYRSADQHSEKAHIADHARQAANQLSKMQLRHYSLVRVVLERMGHKHN